MSASRVRNYIREMVPTCVNTLRDILFCLDLDPNPLEMEDLITLRGKVSEAIRKKGVVIQHPDRIPGSGVMIPHPLGVDYGNPTIEPMDAVLNETIIEPIDDSGNVIVDGGGHSKSRKKKSRKHRKKNGIKKSRKHRKKNGKKKSKRRTRRRR